MARKVRNSRVVASSSSNCRPITSQCMYLHSARKATYVVVMPVSCIEPCTISCMQQKKTDMSRTGVSHSCMVDMHSNVPHMRNTPATKHAANNTGREPVFMHARLQDRTYGKRHL